MATESRAVDRIVRAVLRGDYEDYVLALRAMNDMPAEQRFEVVRRSG